MSILANLTTDSSIANEKDSIGGGSRVIESGIYTFTIQHAYIGKSTGSAISLNLNLKTEDNKELKQQLWITSGTAKGGKNYYIDKNGDKQYLPGFVMANSLCLLTLGKEISELDTEQKVISLYNTEAKAEVPTKVDMLMDLIGKEITAAVFKQIVDKNKKNESTGAYEPTGETREENELDKFFRASDKKTTAEIRAQAEEATFVHTWEKKYAGQTRDKSKGAGGANGTAGAPKAASVGASKPTSSLFA